MTTHAPLDATKLAGLGLIVLGTLSLSIGITYLGSYLAYDWPQTPARCIIGIILGMAATIAGYRLASGTWSGSSQVPHRAAALAGVFFVAITYRLRMKGSVSSLSQSGWVLLALSLVAIATLMQ